MNAAQLAVEMAKIHGSQLVALNVIVSRMAYAYSSGMFGLPSPGSINELLEKSREEANEWFGQIKTKASEKGVSASTEMIASRTSIVPAIVEYAEKNGVDLIMTGTKGKSGLTKVLLGSVASGIITHSPCPVMIVK